MEMPNIRTCDEGEWPQSDWIMEISTLCKNWRSTFRCYKVVSSCSSTNILHKYSLKNCFFLNIECKWHIYNMHFSTFDVHYIFKNKIAFIFHPLNLIDLLVVNG